MNLYITDSKHIRLLTDMIILHQLLHLLKFVYILHRFLYFKKIQMKNKLTSINSFRIQ